MPLVLLTSCCPVLPQDVLPAFVVPALLCVVVLSAQVVVFVEAAGIVAHCLGSSLFGHCYTAIPVGIIAVAWVIPLCRVVILLLVCCIRQVVDCCSTVFGQVTWLATCVAYCYWILSFSLIVGSFVLSLSFACSLHWLPYLLSFYFSFCLAVALVVALSFSFSFVSFALLLSFVSFVSFASSSFSFVCC